MFNIISIPSETVVSSHSLMEQAEAAMLVIETNPPSHEIVEVPNPIEEVTDGNN